MRTKCIATVNQIDQDPIKVFHCTDGGVEWLEIGGARVGLAGLDDLITELRRLESFYVGSR